MKKCSLYIDNEELGQHGRRPANANLKVMVMGSYLATKRSVLSTKQDPLIPYRFKQGENS